MASFFIRGNTLKNITERVFLSWGNRLKQSSLDLEYASEKEIQSIANYVATGVKLPDAAYASYALEALPNKGQQLTSKIFDNAVSAYRNGLLSWFSEALLDRANKVHFGGLNSVLSKYVQDFPEAVLKGKPPKVSEFKAGWGFLNEDRLEKAGLKVIKVIKEDAISEGLWGANKNEKSLLEFNSRYRLWIIRWSSVTSQNTSRFNNMLTKLGFMVDTANKWWYVTSLTPEIKSTFQTEESLSTVPDLKEMKDWYFKKWLPKNIKRFSNLFENYIRDAGSTIVFNFNIQGKGNVKVNMFRGITKISDAIEELRLRYIGRQGREPWLEVMDRVLDLYSTSSNSKKILSIIDRMNNLEHSNGMFMERFPASVKSWYLKFLNAKYHSPTSYELARYIKDSDLRELIQYLSEERRHSQQEFPEYENMKKNLQQEDGINWLEKGYPYARGQKRPKKDDPKVQEGLSLLRNRGSSLRRGRFVS
jgi:hypothetical protein